MNKRFGILFFTILSCTISVAQNDKVSFSGMGRALFEKDKLFEEDTLNPDNVNTGYMLVDLGVDIKPNSTTFINTTIRVRNPYGGFYGQGASVTFRQLYIKGLVANIIKYQFGDINLSLTPYTLYNYDAEGDINEASAFRMLREVSYYENFNIGNTWRQQGGQAEFFLESDKGFEKIRFNGFITRNRATDFISIPERLHGGGSINITQSKYLNVGLNYSNLFSLGQTIDTSIGFANPVYTVDYKLQLSKGSTQYYVKGESGISNLIFKNQPEAPSNLSDFFYEVRGGIRLKKSLSLELTYRDVGPDFYSAGGQTKRIRFSDNPALFSRVTNERIKRDVTIFDVMRDINLYNPIIGYNLMSYDARLNNAMPYGFATPNRRGFTLSGAYRDSAGVIHTELNLSMLSQIRGEGTDKLKSFFLAEGKINLNLAKVLSFNKNLSLSGGYRYEKTKRISSDTLEEVDLTSHLIDAGLDIEVMDKFDLLLGSKILLSKGKEYLNQMDQYNTLTYFDRLKIDQVQTLLGGGIRYRFSPYIFISAQQHFFNLKNKETESQNYAFNQFFILLNMKF